MKVDPKDVETMVSAGTLTAKLIGSQKRITISDFVGFLYPNTSSIKEYQKYEKHLITDLLHKVLSQKKHDVKASTYLWYCDRSKPIEQAFGGKYIEDLTNEEILHFLKSVSINKDGKLMSSRYMQAITSLMKRTVILALQRELIDRNPFDYIHKIPRGKKTDPRERILKKSSVLKLVDLLNSSSIFKPMVILMLRAGLRIGEVLALRWSDIDEDNGIIHVEQSLSVEYDEDADGNLINKHYEIGKTKTACSVRDVTADQEVFDALHEWCDYIDNKPSMKAGTIKKGNQNIIFVNKSGDIRSYQSLRKAFSRFLAKNDLAGIPISFHRFRHTYASILSDAGVDINIIREMLGHKDIQTTANIYVKVNLKPKKEATNKFVNEFSEMLEENYNCRSASHA